MFFLLYRFLFYNHCIAHAAMTPLRSSFLLTGCFFSRIYHLCMSFWGNTYTSCKTCFYLINNYFCTAYLYTIAFTLSICATLFYQFYFYWSKYLIASTPFILTCYTHFTAPVRIFQPCSHCLIICIINFFPCFICITITA